MSCICVNSSHLHCCFIYILLLVSLLVVLINVLFKNNGSWLLFMCYGSEIMVHLITMVAVGHILVINHGYESQICPPSLGKGYN